MGISWSVGLREDQVFDKAKGEVDRKNWATLNAALDAETAARESVDAEIIADKDLLWAALQDESTLRAQDDYELRQEFLGITSSETSIRAAADVSLKAALDSDITAVKALIDTEREERITNDSAVIEQVNNKYDPQITDINAAIANENTLAAKRDDTMFSALSASITAEQKSRGDGDAALQTAINNLGKSAVDSVRAEINARQSADATLQQNIDKVATSITSGSFTVEEFKPSSTTQEGKAGILPAPPILQTEDQILLPTNFGWKSLADTNIYIGTTPSQKFTAEYTGNTVYPTWKDYEEQKLSVRGDLSATAAGTYTVYFKPVGLYCWSDGTRNERAVQWTVAPALIAIPTAATTTFDYTGNVISLNPANVDLTKMDKNGQDSATEQGNYSVTYTLKDPANMRWSNNSTAPVTINWKIELKALAKPSAANTTFTYDGNTRKLEVDNYNASFMTVTGTTSEINAGTYKVTYSLKNKASMQWADGTTNDVTITWTINRQKMTYAESNLTANPLEYTGNKQSVSLNGYNSAKHVLSGDTTGTAAGSYTVTVTPNQNYEWYEGGYDGKQVTWSIGSMSFAKPTADKTVFTYTGNAVSLNVQNVNLNYMDKTGSDTATAKGTYWVKYTLKSASYTWADGSKEPVVINWSIGENAVAIPTLTETNYTYNEKTQTPKIANGESDKFTVTGTTSEINAGTYKITYKLKDKANTQWADGKTDDVVITWVIQRKPMPAAYSYENLTVKSATYDGNVHYATELFNYSATYHTVAGHVTPNITSASTAGAYMYHWQPTDNYCWADGTTTYWTERWNIVPKPIPKPTAAKTSFDYDGATKTLSLTNYNSALMTKSGTDSASAKNSYKVTFTLNDTKNYCWADGTTDPHVITWTIGATAVAKPTVSGTTTFTYDGKAKSITVNGYDSTTMLFSGTTSETEAGEYTATYKLKDKTKYSWDDGTNDDVVFNWKINLRPLAKTTSSNLALKKTTYEWSGTYDSALGGLVGNLTFSKNDFNGWSDYVEITGGNYTLLTQSVTYYDARTDFTIEVSPIKNFCWNDGTRTPLVFHFQITEKLLDKPTISGASSFTYDGTTKSITVANYDGNYMKQSGTLSASNVNGYLALYTLYTAKFKDGSKVYIPYLTKWSDGTTANVSLDWAITAGSGITKPTLSTTEYEWTGGSISPDIKGYNSSTMNVSGTTTASAINTYTVTYSLKDKTNTKWADGSTDDVSLTWKIVRQKLTNDVTIDSGVTLTYNGNSQEPTLRYGSVQWTMANLATYCDLSSQTSATDAGTYTFVATPKATYAWKGGGTSFKKFTWKINKVKVENLCDFITNTNQYYDGTTKSPTIPTYNTSIIKEHPTKSVNSAVDVGDYVIRFALVDSANYEWIGSYTTLSDGSVCVSRKWHIKTATSTLSLSDDEIILSNNNSRTSVTATYTGDGTLTVTSSNTETAIASISGNTVTVKIGTYSTETATVTVSAAATNNTSAASATFTVTSTYIPTLAECTWTQVKQIAKDGNAYGAWNVGDYKTMTVSGTLGSITLSNFTMRPYILDIEHTDGGSDKIHFCAGRNSYGKDIAFVDAKLETYVGNFNTYFVHYASTTEPKTAWVTSQLLINRGQEFYNLLPSELKNCIADIDKFYIDAENKTEAIATNAAQKKIWAMSIVEVFGGASTYPSQYMTEFDYYANGNSYIRFAHDVGNKTSASPVRWWCRDKCSDTDFFCIDKKGGGYNGDSTHYFSWANQNMSLGFVPCFTIA